MSILKLHEGPADQPDEVSADLSTVQRHNAAVLERAEGQQVNVMAVCCTAIACVMLVWGVTLAMSPSTPEPTKPPKAEAVVQPVVPFKPKTKQELAAEVKAKAAEDEAKREERERLAKTPTCGDLDRWIAAMHPEHGWLARTMLVADAKQMGRCRPYTSDELHGED